MTFQKLYSPPDLRIWEESPTLDPPRSLFSQIVTLLDLSKQKEIVLTHKTFAIVGFNCTIEPKGNAQYRHGADAIRNALAKYPVQKPNYQLIDAGNINCANENIEEAQRALGEIINLLFEKGMIPIVLGSNHETAWGHYQGIAKTHPDKNLGIIHFDSHFDLDPLLPNQGSKRTKTSFSHIVQEHVATHRRLDYNCIGVQHSRNIRQLTETAKKYNVKVIWADELHQGLVDKCVDFIDRIIDQNEMVYVSLCLDVFASAFAPGVSDAQPLGLLPWHIIPLIRQLTASNKVISFEIADLSPCHDIEGNTAKLAASLIYEFIHHNSEQPRPW